MKRKFNLENILQKLQPKYIQVVDETHMHHTPIKSESHFKVVLVTTKFENLTKIARHRLVNSLLKDEFNHGLHALSLHLYTPLEWSRLSSIEQSPACRGGKIVDDSQ